MISPMKIGLAVLGLLLALWVGFMAWRVLSAPQRAADAKAGQIMAESGAASGRDAVATVSNTMARESSINDITRSNADAIRQAPGADAPVDPALAAAGRRALCLRASYRDRPECLLKPDPR